MAAETREVQKTLHQIAATLQQQQTLAAQRQDQIDQRQTQVDQQLNTIQAALLQQIQNPPPPPPPAGQPPVFLRSQTTAPEKFGGEPAAFRTFIAHCELYFETRAAEFPTDRSRVTFLVSLLKGQAAKWSLPLWENNDPLLNNYQGFMQLLRQHFDDPAREATATREILRLKQAGRRVVSYIADFKVLAADLQWNEFALKALFKEGLDKQIKDELVRQGMPQTLDALYQFCVVVDSRLQEIRQDPASRGKALQSSVPAISPCPAPLMLPGGEEPMQIGATATRRVLPAVEKQRRREKFLCFYCGAPGHMVRNCPSRGQAAQPKPKPAGQNKDQEPNSAPVPATLNFSSPPRQGSTGGLSSN